MTLRFVCVCDLLEDLERIFTRDPPYLSSDSTKKQNQTVVAWFKTHRQAIDATAGNATIGLALLSSLLPGKRPDRVCALQQRSLERIIGRILALGKSRLSDLARWKDPGAGDLANCVERVAKQTVRLRRQL